MDIQEFESGTENLSYFHKKYFIDQKFCMTYNKKNCSGKIVNAHTVSKKYLRNIADKGKIMMPLDPIHDPEKKYTYKLIGTGVATTLTGFCKHHDEKLFQSFEKKEFVGEYEQIYYLTLRVLCREYYYNCCLEKAEKEIISGEILTSRLNNLGGTYVKNPFEESHSKGLKFLYSALEKYERNGLHYLLIEISPLHLAATGIWFPIFDIDNIRIQDEYNVWHGFIYSIIPLQNKSYITIATPSSLNSSVHEQYLFSIFNLSNKKDVFNYILTSIFLGSDNIALNPSWYDSLCDELKNHLISLVSSQMGDYDQRQNLKIIDFYSLIQPSFIKKSLVINNKEYFA